VLVVQTLVGVAETYFVGFLGTGPLAGVALVFPVLMLMQMMANGGIGGGVSSAVARALGAGRAADAQALAGHAVVVGVGFGALFTAGAWLGGPPLYRALGGGDGALDAALAYSNIVFAGAVPAWTTALLAAALRGAGQVRVPAAITFVGSLALVVVSPALIFGVGPIPRLGVAGAGVAVVLYYLGTSAALLTYLLRGRGPLRLARAPIERRLLRAILSVGGLSAIGTIQANLTVTLVTGAVGLYGTEAIAGYGVAARLDYLLIPLLFGFGTAVVTMVGASVGAGDAARARRVAWIGAAIGGGTVGAIGLAAALAPHGWVGLFSHDARVHAVGAQYLRTVAPFYALYGAGYMMYFASQGAGRVLLPVLGGTVRLVLAGLVGWVLAERYGLPLAQLFWIVAGATVLFGATCLATIANPRWGTRVTPRAAPSGPVSPVAPGGGATA
jgi:putative MATE family efflux protein